MNVVILYNPKSTGNGKANADNLAKELSQHKIKVEVRKTAHAGHGEEIATKFAKRDEKVILISSSGDGGYHDVINGVLKHPASNVVVGVLPSGNANDHHTALGSDSLVDNILKNTFHTIDTIKVTATVSGKPWVRYAHSYVGMGVTATAAQRLTEDRPNAFTEKWIVARSLLSFRFIKIREDGHVRRYSSLLFGNIDTMSKVLKLSDNSSVTDGKFEMSKIRFRSKGRLVLYLLTAATVGLTKSVSMKQYECTALSSLPIQLDGEFVRLDAGSTINIESNKQNLRCVL